MTIWMGLVLFVLGGMTGGVLGMGVASWCAAAGQADRQMEREAQGHD